MEGQWLGVYTGDASGSALLNIERERDLFRGVAYTHPNDSPISSIVEFDIEVESPGMVFHATILPMHPETKLISTWEEVEKLIPPTPKYSKTLSARVVITGDELELEGTTDTALRIKVTARRLPRGAPSELNPHPMKWEEFKNFVSRMSKEGRIYRGQKEPWRLRTGFHRRGRYRIKTFIEKDVPILHRRLSGIVPHYFDLNEASQNGAFYNLLQHHGYPTPFIDWSYSPYVAAFFAFRDWPIGHAGPESARIYVFDAERWKDDFHQLNILDPPYVHVSISEFLSVANPRLSPQQSITMVTNIDDIERFFAYQERTKKHQYLMAIDIPANERQTVMQDLRFMGITAGSMFPGIDGVCEEMREQHFSI